MGRERWIQALEDAVDVFGKGNVMTAFVGGAELDGEGAFANPQEALESNLEGDSPLPLESGEPNASLPLGESNPADESNLPLAPGELKLSVSDLPLLGGEVGIVVIGAGAEPSNIFLLASSE